RGRRLDISGVETNDSDADIAGHTSVLGQERRLSDTAWSIDEENRERRFGTEQSRAEEVAFRIAADESAVAGARQPVGNGLPGGRYRARHVALLHNTVTRT